MKKILLMFISLVIVLSGCDKFEEYETNPNKPGEVPPSLVLSNVLSQMIYYPWDDIQRWNQFWCSNYAYYDDNEYDWTTTSFNFSQLNNVKQMVAEAKRVGLPDVNAYSALAKFFNAYFFVDMTMRLGDIPMTEALKGQQNPQPKYDTQKEVFVQVLKWLDEANSELGQLVAAHDNNLDGDFMMANDISKWQKVVNAYKLRILISLSKFENDQDLNIKAKFAEILGNQTKYPIMSALSDNLQFVFNSSTNKYPLNPDNYGFTATRNNMSATYLNTLVSLQDPRTFIVAEPAPKKLKSGLTKSDYAAYVGANSGESLDDMSKKMLDGEYSAISKDKYYGSYLGEPVIQIGYIEQCFNIAEAILRGWVSNHADDFYTSGIQASWLFHGVTDIPQKWYSYGSQSNIVLSSTTDVAINQVLTQKYLGFFQNSGWEAYYNYRRTGVPTFLTGPGTANSGRIALRWQYPSSERTTNPDNYNKALVNQFGTATDDINSKMWVIK